MFKIKDDFGGSLTLIKSREGRDIKICIYSFNRLNYEAVVFCFLVGVGTKRHMWYIHRYIWMCTENKCVLKTLWNAVHFVLNSWSYDTKRHWQVPARIGPIRPPKLVNTIVRENAVAKCFNPANLTHNEFSTE